jgi:hypothetical protein
MRQWDGTPVLFFFFRRGAEERGEAEKSKRAGLVEREKCTAEEEGKFGGWRLAVGGWLSGREMRGRLP